MGEDTTAPGATVLWQHTQTIKGLSGEVLALLGPSGAGKTTLLNMLTLERSGGWPSGSITLNGRPFTKEVYQLAVDRQHTPGAARQLCVAVKRKLLLYRYEHGSFQYVRELGPLAEPPQALAWYGERICVGYRREYALISQHEANRLKLVHEGFLGSIIASIIPS